MTIPLQKHIAYGPIASRRLGRSLGVNVLPEGCKVCNFNCPYCQYGWTPQAVRERLGVNARLAWPPVRAIIDAVDEALRRDSEIDRITLAGNGEPTLHPDFSRIVEGLRLVRANRSPKTRLAILSNASTSADPGVAAALSRMDECYMKLDAGDDVMLRRMNGSPVPIRSIVDALRGIPRVTLQSLFTRDAAGRIDNTSPDAIARWIEAVRTVRPAAVHVYTIDRDPAWARLERVPRAELDAIAAQVEREGISALVF
jgi:wyosine [tRNA(Phe)-imidazoG37] synthetase (radical SAM superfamily)